MYTCVINQVDDNGSLLFCPYNSKYIKYEFWNRDRSNKNSRGFVKGNHIVTMDVWWFVFFKFQFTSRATSFVCIFFFLWIFRRKEGSKSTSRLIFMVVTTTYYEVLISDVDQYFIYPFNDKINGQLYCLIHPHYF